MSLLKLFALYGSAVGLVFGSLYLERRQRIVLLLPVWTLLILCFWNIDLLTPFFGLDVQFGMLVIITFLRSPIMLASAQRPLDPNEPYWNLPSAYRSFINPRSLVPLPPKQRNSSKADRRRFAFSAVLKALAVLGCYCLLNFTYVLLLLNAELQSFAPEKEEIILRLLDGKVTSHELMIRTFVSLHWICETYADLTLVHLGLGIVFVCGFEVDEPEEWPPLFGSPLEAFTLRRFWGSFWHRLFTPSAVRWAEFATAHAPIQMHLGKTSKVFTAFFVFSVSGIAHIVVGWRLGANALTRELFFFWTNFIGISLEIGICSMWKQWHRRNPYPKLFGMSKSILAPVCWRVVGYILVVGVFVTVTPYATYPKIHEHMRTHPEVFNTFV